MQKMFLVILIGVFLNGGCQSPKKLSEPAMPLRTLSAAHTPVPVVIDGKLDDPVWKRARVYPLYLAKDLAGNGKALQECGQVQLAWDDHFFYIGVKFYDSDIVAEGKKDQLHQYTMGDLCELFLKPADSTWYWELYATPAGKKTSFFFPGRGRLGLPSMEDYTCGLKVAAQVCGTLNHWQDRDSYWTAEMAMPVKDLTALGNKFGPGNDWRILVARYNYSRYLTTQGTELSMTPQLRATN